MEPQIRSLRHSRMLATRGKMIQIFMPRPHRVGALCNDDGCLSVCLSVCHVLDPKSRTEGHSKLKMAGGKPMIWVTRDPFRGPIVKGQGHQAD